MPSRLLGNGEDKAWGGGVSGKASKRAKPLSVLTDEIGLAIIAQTAYGESICMAGSFCPLSSLFLLVWGGGGLYERARE